MTDPRARTDSVADEEVGGEEGVTGPRQQDQQPKRGRRRSRSLWADAGRDLIRNPVFVISALVVLVISSMAAFRGLWTGVDPHICDLAAHSKEGPSLAHPFGFTVQGCDMYAQVIYGARPSIVIAVLCTLGTALIGTVLGTLAAFYGRLVDTLLSRLTDIVFGLPFLLGALIFLSLIDVRSIWTITAVITLLAWPPMVRLMRGSTLATQNADFVMAAKAVGASNARIIRRHILPNAIAPVIVYSTIALGGFVSAEATLTYLGVGLRAPTISWGVLIADGDSWALAGDPHLLLFPCAFLIITVLSFILLGDAVRDALDPKLR